MPVDFNQRRPEASADDAPAGIKNGIRAMQEVGGPDSSLFQWIVSGMATLFAAALAYTHARITEVGKVAKEASDHAAVISESDLGKLWGYVETNRRDFDAFRDRMLSEMASKTDLREMEARLMSAIRAAS